MNALARTRLEKAFIEVLRRRYPGRAWSIVRDDDQSLRERVEAADRRSREEVQDG